MVPQVNVVCPGQLVTAVSLILVAVSVDNVTMLMMINDDSVCAATLLVDCCAVVVAVGCFCWWWR